MAGEPASADTSNDVAIAQLKHGETDAALHTFQQAIARWPEDQRLRRNFAQVLDAMGRDTEALVLLQGIPLHEREEKSAALLIKLCKAAGRTGEAALWQTKGDEAQAHGNAGKAAACYREALKADPESAAMCRRLCEAAPKEADAALIRHMVGLLSRPALADRDAADLHIALFRALDARGQYEAAFSHLEAANACKRRTLTYHEAGALHVFSALGKAFPADFFRDTATRDAGFHPTPTPKKTASRAAGPRHVFIIGMPRSGSTLVEQILASHSDVFAAGERTDFPTLTHQLCPPDPATWPTLPPEILHELGQRYRTRLQTRAPQAKVIVDKLPANAVYAGLIALALPEAKIIWVERNAMDCAFSCYCQIFSDDLPWLYDQGELGRYARELNQLLNHWETVLPPDRFRHLHYEDLVAEPEANMRALIAFCGLGWQEECLHFEKTDRAVHTASALAVRRPLDRSTGGRWKPYRSGLTRLAAALARDDNGLMIEGCCDEDTGPGETGDRQ